MHLYNLTLQKPSGIVCAVYGNFSGPKAQEIIVSRGKIIELLRPDDSGRLQVILSVDVFGVVRSLIPFRLTGGTKDYIVVGSDSGRIVILEYNPATNRFDKVHQETFGKSGCRRIVPGQYLAADPKGRAVLIGSVEKQKLVYVLNRDASARLTISSPLEAHKAHTILFSVIGVDVGFDNPIFACIEVDYEEEGEEGQKHLTYYELDLGLNHVSRKWSEPINPKSNMLIPVPGSSDGPSGVLICSENYVTYKHQGHPSVVAKIPRRRGHLNNESLLIVASALVKQKDMFFFLLQSEYGDLYKVTLSYKEDAVQAVNIEYFDTVPVATSLCVMKTGFLFVASEFGNHFLYQFKPVDEQEKSIQDADMEIEEEWQHFVPHKERNLVLIDEMSSLSPITDMKVADLCHEETPQIYAACGRGPQSTLRILRHGIPVSEMAVSPLPGNPSAVWTIRQNLKEEYDKYIVVSFVNATLVLAVGETVEEASDTGFLNNVPTIHVANMGDDGMVQVHPTGIRHIRGEGKRIHEWKTPGKKSITHASSNTRQLAIALSGGDIVYFELDQTGQLVDIDKKFMGREIACLDIAPIPKGRQRTRFLAVGDWDNTLRILSLDPQDSLQALSLQALPTLPESLAIVEMSPIGTTPGTDTMNNLFITIGLNNGVLLRSIIDTITGELSDTRTRFLGARAVKLLKISLKESSQQKNAILALSSRSWLGYNNESRFEIIPLSYSSLEHAATFTSEPCPEGIVAIAGNTLRIFTIDRLGEIFNQHSIPLLYTPRKVLIHPLSNHVITIESDHNTLPDVQQQQQQQLDNNNNGEGHRQLREIKGGNGVWASCIRLMDVSSNPSSPSTLDVIQMSDNEAALCMCTCVFHDRDGDVMVVVGTAKDLILKPSKASCGFIHVYKVVDNQLQLVHKTPIEMPPTALCAFQGRLLVGMGSILRIYDLGKKKLLRKCESRNFGNCITQIWTQGDRLYVSDVQESVAFAKYKKSENQLYIFADETTPRWLTSTCVLDYDTISGVDKFGNIFVSRLPGQVSDDVEEDPTGTKLKVEQGFLNGATHKLDDVIQFHIGDTCNVILKSSLVPGGAEALLFGGIMGTIGALLPFMSREDIDFFTHLEMYMRQENPPLCGRDHLSYRSYYFPVKNVIDGDLCEQFYSLPADKQRSIANELERTPLEVMKKLEDMRNRLL